jgi:hypothetical protein
MIEITRKLARQFRSVVRRAMNVTGPRFQPAIDLLTGPDGLRIRARSIDAAVEYHQPGERPAEQLTASYDLLADCEGRKEEPVKLEGQGRHVMASWREGAVLQQARYERPENKVKEWPAVPDKLLPINSRLWHALEDAADNTDQDSPRYALQCIQLCPSGRIVATDGHSALIQEGFALPWKEDVLLPANKVFGSRELPLDEPILLGREGDWITLRLGPWTIQLATQKEGRFPNIDQYLRRAEDAVARCAFSPTDAEFLIQNLPRLPVLEDEQFHSVTIALDGQAVIRCGAPEGLRPTELVLRGSRASGEPIQVASDWRHLLRALRLGFCELFIYGQELPLYGISDKRTYLWMPAPKESVVGPSENVNRVESPQEGAMSTNPEPEKARTMPKKTKTSSTEFASPGPANGEPGNGAPHGHPDASSEAPTTADTPIAEALALKQALQDALGKTSALIAALRRQGRQSRLLRSTLESLQELQRAGV